MDFDVIVSHSSKGKIIDSTRFLFTVRREVHCYLCENSVLNLLSHPLWTTHVVASDTFTLQKIKDFINELKLRTNNKVQKVLNKSIMIKDDGEG